MKAPGKPWRCRWMWHSWEQRVLENGFVFRICARCHEPANPYLRDVV